MPIQRAAAAATATKNQRRACELTTPAIGTRDRRLDPVSEAVILSAVRTPVGRYGGALSESRPDDLAAHVIKAAVERAGVPAGEIEDVYFGAANQAGEDNRNVARMAALLAGLPRRWPASPSTACAPPV